MAVSGSTDFTMTRDEIIKSAMRKIGVLGFSQSPSTDELTEHTLTLNAMIKSWQADGLNLWTKATGRIFLQDGKSKYKLNSSTGDVAASGQDIYETTISGDQSSGASSLTVTSTTNMSATNYITVEQSDGTVLNTTIVSVDSSTTLTLTSPLTADVDDDARVTTYTTKLDRPLEIRQLTFKNASGIERHVELINEDEYRLITNKTQEGTVTKAYYDPQLTTGYLHLWMTPSDSTGVLEIDYTRVINDFDSGTNNPDLPQEWMLPLIFNLAMLIAPNYGKGDDIAQTIGPMAQTFYQNLLGWDSEKNSFMIVEDTDNRG